ncbi:TonB-dependent receptor plug domain-containing protein [Dyella sp. KULCS107]|uniref:TonB-dependent receptor plug domain-containing protein n=1 Tax=Dyella sp. KULCS107 TaxID=3422216 RepID=UPI003D6E3AE5
MKTRTLRNAISIALLVAAAGVGEQAAAQDTSANTDKQGRAPTTHAPAKMPATESANADTPAPTNLQTITVTGTRIRGGTTPSPVITIGSEQIQQEGFTDLGEVIRSVPQNFSGGQNPGVTIGATAGGPSNQNITGGSGMDLRGLGPDATLTLLNGRRMSYGGYAQSVDISAIPVEAVDRLEIVPDGASAIYGSDAVGGVANVILRRDFDGVTAGARYGGATEGGLITREYHATAGTTWATGDLLVAGEKTSNSPVYSDQRDYTQSMYRKSTLWQANELRSGVLSLHQLLGDAVEFSLDGLRSHRAIRTSLAYPDAYYPYHAKTDTTLASPSLEFRLPNDWTLTLGGAVGKDETSIVETTVTQAANALTSEGVTAYRNKSRSYEIGAEGPLFTLAGGEARLASGVGYRYNTFENLNVSGGKVDADGDQRSRFAYAELDVPLVGPDQGISGIERLSLTGAVRTEDGDYGTVTTPKLGVIYSPTSAFSLKASWGKSFKAPTLLQRYSTQMAIYYPASSFGAGYPADATALWLSGGNADLRPERARTWSASLALHPEASSLEAELTWFHVDYTERVLQPITSYDVFGNPIYTQFVDYGPSQEAQAEALANTSNFYNYVGAPYDASKVVAIIDGRYVNASRQKIKGVDLSASYRFKLGAGRLTVRGSASVLHSTQALTAAQTPYDLAGTVAHPARINSRVGAVWSQGGFAASFFSNFKSGVRNPADGRDGASFTTFDATLSYDTGTRWGALANVTLELSAQNLLNRAPPSYAVSSMTYTPYDSTNYSSVGRFVSLSATKHW